MVLTDSLRKHYSKNYKKLLLIPTVIIIISVAYLAYFISVNGDFIKKDFSLTGGTSITIFSETEISVQGMQDFLSTKNIDFRVHELSDFRTGKQKAVIVESPIGMDELKGLLQEHLGYELNSDNSTIESTGSSLGEGFYKQLLYAIILSFSFMALVVFFIFGGHMKMKIAIILVTFIPFFLFLARAITVDVAIVINIIILLISMFFYFKYSIPSAAVVLSAFADILMTLAVVDILGITVSSAGIVAFLMLIGYSVDTDIMLTTRLLKHEGGEKKLWGAFKTGITMTITSIAAVAAALFITQSFSDVLKQIFTILLIGLFFDIMNTWLTNAGILKWYLERIKK